jgi:ElaB/YqjD/DUF883 family membrane-anchored ribosome-binding protein
MDTLSFARAYRSAQGDEDRAALIASFVSEVVRTQGDGAASRADLKKLGNELAGFEAKLDQMLATFGNKAETDAATIDGKVDAALARIDGKLAGDLGRLDAKMNALATQMDKKIESETDRAAAAAGKGPFWGFIFMLLTIIGTFIALKSPLVAAQAAKIAPGLFAGAPPL